MKTEVLKTIVLFSILITMNSCRQNANVEISKTHEVLIKEELVKIDKEFDSVKKLNDVKDLNYIELVEFTKKQMSTLRENGADLKIIEGLIDYYNKHNIDVSEIQYALNENDKGITNADINILELHLLKKCVLSWLRGKIISDVHMYKALKYDQERYLFSFLPYLDSANSNIQYEFINDITGKMERVDTSLLKIENENGLYLFKNLSGKEQNVLLILKKKNGELKSCQFEIPAH